MVPYCYTVSRHCLLLKRPFGKTNKCHCYQTALYYVTHVTVTDVTLSVYVCIKFDECRLNQAHLITLLHRTLC